MTFGEKVKSARIKLKLTQAELAEKYGTTVRVIYTYEADRARPRTMDACKKLANLLEVNVNHLLTDDEQFIVNANAEYGPHGAKQAKELLESATGLFAGGDIAEEDKDVLMRAIQDAYWMAKDNNKKYIPKKYRSEE